MSYAPVVPLEIARLLKIAGGGFSENYRQAAGTDTDKWSGDVGAFLEERQNTKVGKDSNDELDVTKLTIPAGLVDIERGDSITYRYAGADHTREVKNLAQRDLIGTTRIEFFDG